MRTSSPPHLTLPKLPRGFVYRLDLARAATPRLLKKRPIHRWYAFPHSYSPELVEEILKEWKIRKGEWILDPFAGAGTTLVVAKDSGYPSCGTDLLPLAVFVARTKTNLYDVPSLLHAHNDLKKWLARRKRHVSPLFTDVLLSRRITKAFTVDELSVLLSLHSAIYELIGDHSIRDFFLLALLSLVPEFSRAQANGGWFRWVEKPDQSNLIIPRFLKKTEDWIQDITHDHHNLTYPQVEIYPGDARTLHSLLPQKFSALITSPPYPNRHDYTRIFQIELLLLGVNEQQIFDLRYSSLRSHIEAKAPTFSGDGHKEYQRPQLLQNVLKRLDRGADPRVLKMLDGYFEDLFLFLESAQKILSPGARIALVVGNVRYSGIVVPVDEILAQIGEQVGLIFDQAWVIRLRGNSAQQMGRYGRVLSRETIVMFRKPIL